MGRFKSLLYKGFLSFLFIMLSLSFSYAAPVGKFTYIKGRVDVTSPGKKAIPAKVGMSISVGDIIRAKSKSKAEIVFNDGNILRLAQSTRVEITEYMVGKTKSSSILSLFRGRIQNIVKKKWAKKIAGFTKAHKFEVHTPIAVVGVKGTNFFTFHTHLGSGAAFKEGTGYCYPKNMPQRRVYVFPGQRVFIPSPTAQPVVKPVPKTEIERYERETMPEEGGRKGEKGRGGAAPEAGPQGGKGKGGPSGKAAGEAAPGAGAAGAGTPPGPPPEGPEAGLGGPETTPVPAGGTTTPTGTERTEGERVYIPVTETEPEKTLDTTPPKIAITHKPASATNSNRAFLEWESDDPTATYYYRIDDGEWHSTTETAVEISNLSEGRHVFEVKAVDEAGNESQPDVYDWRTDYTAPTVNVTPTASPESEANKSKVEFELTSNEPTTYNWQFDNQSGTAHGTTLSFSNVDEGEHRFSFTAEDEVGNSTQGEIPFEIKRYSMRGDITGQGSLYEGEATGDISAVLNKTWGGWVLDLNGTYNGDHSDAWDIIAGGGVEDSDSQWRGYWMHEAEGSYDGSDMRGDSELHVLTKHSLGVGIGDFYGEYDDQNTTWQGTSTGDYSHSSLAYSGEITYAESDDYSEGPYYGLYGDNGSGGFGEIGDIDALIGGTESPWNNTTDIYAMGEHSVDNDDVGPYIWNDDIYSYNWDISDHSTYDSGVFKGFVGGVCLPDYSYDYDRGDMDARIVAIYMTPNGDVGYMKGSLSGSYFPDIEMMNAMGSWTPYKMTSYSGISPEEFYNSIKTDKYMTAEIYGNFGEGNGNIDGINFFEGSWTRYLDGEYWGIYDLIINGYDSYSNPDNETAWSAKIGGGAKFGTYQDNNSQYTSDYGYWIADVQNGTWQDNKLTAQLSGSFLTLTKMGSIDGDMLGYYDDQGHWAATSLGVYKGERITFSSNIKDGMLSVLVPGTLHEGMWENSSTDEAQEYEYIDAGYGWGTKDYEDSTISHTEYFPDHTYIKTEEDEGKPPVMVEADQWPEEFVISSVGNIPDPNDPNWTQTEGDNTSDANIIGDAGSFDAIMGGYLPENGPDSLWESTQDNPASIILMGELDINAQHANDYLLFGSEIRSYNPYNYTDTTPDGGAYWGWIGGIMDDVEGGIRALYIDPNGNAGILKGSFSGNDYRSIDMFKTDGTIYAEQKAQSIGINASELMDNISQGYIFGDMHGLFDDNNGIEGSGSGNIAYISDQSWGIYEMIYGQENTYNNPSFLTSFNAKTGGIICDYNNFGFWIGDFSNTEWQDNRLYALLSGNFLSMRNKGIINGELIGTYRSDNTWQAASMGEWEKTEDLSFSSYMDTGLYMITSGTLHEGETENPAGDLYEYEYISEGRGYAWKSEENNGVNDTSYSPDHTYVTLSYQGDGIPPVATGRGEWPGDFQPSDVSDPPAGFGNPTESTSASSIINEAGNIAGIMGGTESIWTASEAIPATIDLMGYIDQDDSSNNPSIFSSSVVKSYNPDNDTFTTLDGGAYAGYIAGNVGSGIDGLVYALYIAPDGQKAGYIKGSFNGSAYTEIGMWEADGSIYPVQKIDNIDISPDELVNNLDKGFMNADIKGNFQNSDATFSGMGFGTTLSIRTQEWGIYELNFGIDTSYDQNPTSSFDAKLGGMGEFDVVLRKDIGFWLADISSGGFQNNMIDGDLSGHFLTMKKWGTITGKFTGSYIDDPRIWQAVSVGEWEKTDPLYFASWTEAKEMYQLINGSFVRQDSGIPAAIMGGLEPIWTATESDPADIRFMGEINNIDNMFVFRNTMDVANNTNCFVSYNVNNDSYTTLDNGAYDGFMGGIADGNKDSIQGLITAIYVDPDQGAGILMGDFSGSIYNSIDMWEADGGVYPVALTDDIGFSASELKDNIGLDEWEGSIDTTESVGTFDAGGNIQSGNTYKTRNVYIQGEAWGIWQDVLGGTYNGNTSDTWESYLFSADQNGNWDATWEVVATGNTWSENIIKADVAGAWVSWQDAITGVSGGRLVGTFDPSNWQAIAQGASMETSHFLQMVENGNTAQLQQLKIPCIELGRVDLSGSDGNLNVNMKDVIFFSYTTGAPPKIWASAPTNNNPNGGVSGTYVNNPNVGTNVRLNGNGFNNVNFTIKKWQNNIWGAKINGQGTIGGYNINMKGAGAGQYGSNAFRGTASGIAQTQQ